MYTIPEKNIYKLPDGKLWEGNPVDVPTSQADLVAKAGKEYPTAWLKEQGWGKKKAAPKKAAPKKPAEEKAVKKSDVEDKAVKKDVEDK
tara:strand:+ start:4095 stop:4361 length:267 start_codon:yes stop_codon:yes gene_type:complete